MKDLSTSEIQQVNGGIWGHIAIGIAVADAGYDFIKGYMEHRKRP
ncbi:class IIb bacteriocin, lactobin A/cerein 7B family [Aestuariibacter sp. A3R04]|nr:class IIb bacteriocin, lactobin A/cerein 7B family [Aestuariibacter sp. A3R04]MBU3021682.1 class IIb bacteriocin, lactobin A/cerein 7B family [Aestuariibacter sp. A3R04]